MELLTRLAMILLLLAEALCAALLVSILLPRRQAKLNHQDARDEATAPEPSRHDGSARHR